VIVSHAVLIAIGIDWESGAWQVSVRPNHWKRWRTMKRHFDKKWRQQREARGSDEYGDKIGYGKFGVIGAIERKGNVVCRIIGQADARTLPDSSAMPSMRRSNWSLPIRIRAMAILAVASATNRLTAAKANTRTRYCPYQNNPDIFHDAVAGC
jgi:hypothetical protein